MWRLQIGCVVTLTCLGPLFCVGANGEEGRPLDVRVMSFNIRYGTAKDGDNHWDRRKEFLVETIKAFRPDLLGTQETLVFQEEYLASKLPAYEHLGVGRDDGKEQGETVALYYSKERFEKLDGGHFWLSETPEVPGSKSWDSALTRMVTWVRLRDRKNPASPPLAFINTHFDHRGTDARFQSARLLRTKLATLGKDCTIVVTGDFNANDDTNAYQALFAPADGQPSPLVDTYREKHPTREANQGTFSGFKANATGGPRIDWIGASRDWNVVAAAIDHTERDGHTPSDHFPVTALLRR